MKYVELYEEYKGLLSRYCDISIEMNAMPIGRLVKKRISGKEYTYLQYTINGKRSTEYIRESEVEAVQAGLLRRDTLHTELGKIKSEIFRLQQAMKILSPYMSRVFSFMYQCAQMDAIPLKNRSRALSFASAITALEGLPAREATENSLSAWSRGELPFLDIYLPALKSYGVLGADDDA